MRTLEAIEKLMSLWPGSVRQISEMIALSVHGV